MPQIDQLPVVPALAATALFPLTQAGTTYSATMAVLAAEVQTINGVGLTFDSISTLPAATAVAAADLAVVSQSGTGKKSTVDLLFTTRSLKGTTSIGNDAANYLTFTGAAVAVNPSLSVASSGTNAGLILQMKGTGVLQVRDKLEVGRVSNAGGTVLYGPFGANSTGTNGALSVTQSVTASGTGRIAVANFATAITGTSTANSPTPFSFSGSDNSSAYGTFLTVAMNYGGSAWSGGRNGQWINITSNSDAVNANTPGGNFILALAPWWRATHWMGGYPGGETKEIFGMNPLGYAGGLTGQIGARRGIGLQAFEADWGAVYNQKYLSGGRFISWGQLNDASFTASISGFTMTVTAVASGTLSVGQSIASATQADDTRITALGTGTGGTGTYTVNKSQTVSSTTFSAGPPVQGVGYWLDAGINFGRFNSGHSGMQTIIGLGDWSGSWPIRASVGTIMETFITQSSVSQQPVQAAAIGFNLPDMTFDQAFAWSPGFFVGGTGHVGGRTVSGNSLQTVSGVVAKTAVVASVTVVRGGLFAAKPTLTFAASPGGGTTATGSVGTMAADWPRSMAGSAGARGTGYVVGDVLTDDAAKGTASVRFQYTVRAVDSVGAIIDMEPTTPGSYTVVPSDPVTLTGGTGTGATVGPYWTILSVTVAGGGTLYSEQVPPYITVSGGGGSQFRRPILIPQMTATQATLVLNSGGTTSATKMTMGGALTFSAADLTPVGIVQATAAPIVTDMVYVASPSVGNTAVKLPTATPGRMIFVEASNQRDIIVWPQAGEKISTGVNNSVAVSVDSTSLFVCTNASNGWYVGNILS